MKLTRREFVRTSAIGAVGVLAFKASLRDALAFYQSPVGGLGTGIPLFGTTLRGVPGIPVALPDKNKAKITGVTHYTIDIRQFRDQIVPASSGLGKTTLWGYVPAVGLAGITTPTHLGGIIVAKKGTPIQITFRNRLPFTPIIPFDPTQLMASDSNLGNRAAVHLHGGLIPWISDGGPFDWFAPNGMHGPSFLNNDVLNPAAKDSFPGYAEYYYSMNLSSRMLWYHDHAHGITRTNAYAGLATVLLLRDSYEIELQNSGLPGFLEAGGNELPLVFQDKIFVGSDLATVDPGYTGVRTPGSLWYAHTYEPNNSTTGAGRWDLGAGGLALPDPSSIPEFFGDTMLVNGTSFPEVTVQARRYRFRLLNACNARFLNLQMYIADSSAPDGIVLDASGAPTNAPFVNAATGDSSFLQIGAEGGFLNVPAKVPCNVPLSFVIPPDPITGQVDPSPANYKHSLVVAPAERPDIIVDFSNYTPGTQVILYSDAPAPFPSGDDRNDYFPGWNVGTGDFGLGNPVNGLTQPGFGPNTRVLMRFNVVEATGEADEPLNLPATMPGLAPWHIDPEILRQGVATPPGVKTRFLSLNEYFDSYGRLVQILGNEANPFGAPYAVTDSYLNYGASGLPATVNASEDYVKEGDTEVWEVFNATGDVHPMHFHLVNVQIINRQLFDVANLAFNTFSGPVIPPEDNELGWKETIPMYPGTVTRFIAKFDMSQAKIVAANGRIIPTPSSPRTGGAEYVWHCHILEHEEHDMMHALVVT